MSKIIGNPTVTPVAVPDWNQTDPTKVDCIKNKPDVVPIELSASGENITITDSAEARLRGLKLYGKSEQNGTPNPDNPVEIVSVGDGGDVKVNVSGQILTVPTPKGLPGLPTNKVGNYIDSNGQHYLCDEIDFTKGVYVQKLKKIIIDDALVKDMKLSSDATDTALNITAHDIYGFKDVGVFSCNYFEYSNNNNIIPSACLYYGNGRIKFRFDRSKFPTVDDAKAWFKSKCDEGNPVVFIGQLAESIEITLSEEELVAYKELYTHYPVTNITNDSGAGMEVKYVADTKMYIDNKIAEMKAELTAAIITE